MIVRHLPRVHALLSMLDAPTAERRLVRALRTEAGRFPTRRTWERRLNALPHTLPAPIGCVGRWLVARIDPWATSGRAVAIDSTVLRANGGVWPQPQRGQGGVPPPAMDPEAHWPQSGWHGWVDGWKLPLVTVVAAVWSPVAAERTAATHADHEVARLLWPELPPEAHGVLGDTASADPVRHQRGPAAGRILMTPSRGPDPHADDGVEVRRLLHKLRSLAREHFNAPLKGRFDGHGPVPTQGLHKTRRLALGAIVVYQLVLWYRFEHGLDLRVGLKAFLKAA